MKPSQRIAALAGIAILVLTTSAVLASEGVVNINTASESQLMLLPRVGPSLAKKIVEYRQANGEFKAADELVLVPGIGERTYELMAPYITVKGDTTLKEKAKGERRAEGGGAQARAGREGRSVAVAVARAAAEAGPRPVAVRRGRRRDSRCSSCW